MKTAELTGAALDYKVAKCEGLTCFGHELTEGVLTIVLSDGTYENFSPSRSWAQGGAIIERENISITGTNFPWWECDTGWYAHIGDRYAHGETPLIAAMRCYVASKLGDKVELPEELMTNA